MDNQPPTTKTELRTISKQIMDLESKIANLRNLISDRNAQNTADQAKITEYQTQLNDKMTCFNSCVVSLNLS